MGNGEAILRKSQSIIQVAEVTSFQRPEGGWEQCRKAKETATFAIWRMVIYKVNANTFGFPSDLNCPSFFRYNIGRPSTMRIERKGSPLWYGISRISPHYTERKSGAACWDRDEKRPSLTKITYNVILEFIDSNFRSDQFIWTCHARYAQLRRRVLFRHAVITSI